MRKNCDDLNSNEWFKVHLNAISRYEVSRYFADLFFNINKEFSGHKSILEIGAGSGISKMFLDAEKFFATDIIINNNQLDVAADIYNLPFCDQSFDLIFTIDTLHHLRDFEKAIMEIGRVMKSNGTLMIVEPYISIFSYPIYKIFHHENTSWKIGPEEFYNSVEDDPLSANNSLITSFLFYKKWTPMREKILFNFSIDSLKFRDFLSFFVTGGLQRNRSILKGKKFDWVLLVEKYLPQIFFKYFGSRVILKLTKI
jgi:SAM-dependent methyltransferase